MFRNSFNLPRKKIYSIGFIVVLLISVSTIGCKKDLFIKDISEKNIVLISPGNGVSLKSQTVTFIWDEMEDATSYRFRLATPQFDSIKLLLIDSVSKNNTIAFTLSPGVYEWQIRGENDGYQSPYSTFKINIDSTSSLEGFQLVLSSPKDSLFTNSSSPIFSWEKISLASEYNFKIVEGTDFEKGNLFTSTITTSSNSMSLSKPLENGSYIWGVNAENEASKTLFSKRFVHFDDIVPSKAQLTTPINGSQQFNGNITFSWNSVSDLGSPIKDTLYVATDNLFSNLKVASEVNSQTYQDSLGLGTYYWRISRTDRAGNWSGYSNTFNFTIL